MEANGFNSILIERGDRVAIQVRATVLGKWTNGRVNIKYYCQPADFISALSCCAREMPDRQWQQL